MKTIFKHTALVAGLAFLCVSCNDKLVTPPVGSLSSEGYFSTPAHIEEGLRGTYSKIRDVEVMAYANFSELRSDNIVMDPNTNAVREPAEVGHYRFSPSLGGLLNLWSRWYSLIYNANNVLENLDKMEFSNEAVKNQFKGELLFLRAYAHFELVREFGNVPFVDHVLSSQEAKELKQTPGADILVNNVIPDLKTAVSLLPYQKGMLNNAGSSASSEFRADKLAAQAMLARVYMTAAGWPYNIASAKAEAKPLLESVVTYALENGYWAEDITEWKKMFTTDRATQNKYFIFSVQHTASTSNVFAMNTCGQQLSQEYLPTTTTTDNTGYNGNIMTPALVEAATRYEFQKTGDERGKFCILDIMDPFGLFQGYTNRETEFTLDNGERVKIYEQSLCTKWIPYRTKRESVGVQFDDVNLGGGTGSGWPMNFPIIRLEDMMLLNAELLVEDNKVADAMAIVNKIRTRAGIEARPTNCSAADALNFVKMERKLELFGEGVRWFDEIRYGEWKEATVNMMNRYVNSSYAGHAKYFAPGNVTDGKYLLPIPDTEMRNVPGLYVQNPGW